MITTVKRLRPETSVLVEIDIQDRLLVKIPVAGALLQNTAFLLDVAALLQVPIRATAQYPKGLGPTNETIARRLPSTIVEKTTFSSCGAGTFLEELEMMQRPDIILVGMETHVCVQQTALDLLAAGRHVFLPVDALAARAQVDHETALHRMDRAGAVLTTCEAIAFEWLRDSNHPQFKAVSKLVVDRAEPVPHSM